MLGRPEAEDVPQVIPTSSQEGALSLDRLEFINNHDELKMSS